MANEKEAKQGEDLLLSIDGKISAAAESMSFESTVETREVTAFKQGSKGGRYTRKKVVKISWSAQTDNAIMDWADYVALLALHTAGEPVPVKVVEATLNPTTGEYTANTTGINVDGEALITSVSLNGPKDGEVTVSVKLEGTGPYTTTNKTTA